MNRDKIIAVLRDHEGELRSAGILGLSLVGSMVRGERGNDVDLMAQPSPAAFT